VVDKLQISTDCEALDMLELALVGVIIAAFELAALRWGTDSRRSPEGTR
jgi:hypothetical protein